MEESHGSSNSRILFVDLSGRRGGAEASLDELIAAMAASHPATYALATARTDAAPPCEVFRIPAVRPCRPSPTLRFLSFLVAYLRSSYALGRVLCEFNPDIVHANGIAALLATPPSDARIIWHVRDMPRRPRYARFAAARCDAVLAISRPVAEACSRAFAPADRGKIRLVENGIDLTRFDNIPSKAQARAALGLPADGPAVGMVAHLVPWKRHDTFVAAAARLRDYRDASGAPVNWILAGRDLFGEHKGYIGKLRRAVRDAGLEDRFFWIDGHDGAEVIPALDLLVHPAEGEPFGRVICEAMASGVPVVARDDAGPGSILENGKTGFLVETQEAAAFAERIAFALSHPEVSAAAAAAAAAVVRDRYAVGRVADDVYALYLFFRHTS